jgi:hypothetical protein
VLTIQKLIPHKAGKHCSKLGACTYQDDTWSHCKSSSTSRNTHVLVPTCLLICILMGLCLPHKQPAAITSGRAIPALSAIYLFWTFGASGAISAAGQAMSREEGLDNDHPRKHIQNLEGFPLRLRSAHYALMENFPGSYCPCHTHLLYSSLRTPTLSLSPQIYTFGTRTFC